jgi:hypothetical protein
MSEFVITLKDNKTGESKDIVYKSDILYGSPEEELENLEYMWSDNDRFEVTSIKRLNRDLTN